MKIKKLVKGSPEYRLKMSESMKAHWVGYRKHQAFLAAERNADGSKRFAPVCRNTLETHCAESHNMKLPPPGVNMPSVSTFEVCNPAWWERQEWELLIGVLHATTVALRHKQDRYKTEIEAIAGKAGLEVIVTTAH